MNIALFNEVTTEQALLQIEQDSQKDIGIYVEMNDPKQRKYIKEQALDINGLLKSVDRARISLSKEYKVNVEAQAKDIRERLEKANEPFTLLIDGYNDERKRILDAEKERKAKEEATIQKECDHEYAILLDKSYLGDKLAAEKAQADRDEVIRADAEQRATLAAKSAQEATDRAIEQDAANRLANKEHVRTVNRAIFKSFTNVGLTPSAATIATQALIDKQIPHITINY